MRLGMASASFARTRLLTFEIVNGIKSVEVVVEALLYMMNFWTVTCCNHAICPNILPRSGFSVVCGWSIVEVQNCSSHTHPFRDL